MYQEHPSFQSIPDDTKIWRFMDLAHFCDILETSSLFFIKPHKFSDPWEGYLPKKHYEKGSYEQDEYGIGDFEIKLAKEVFPSITREDMAVNCWHISNYESEAFWRNYSKRGIVIQTTFGRLKESLIDKEYNVHIGKIQYKDNDTEFVDLRNVFNHLLWKRKSFEYENELRAVITQKSKETPFVHPSGQPIQVEINKLIEAVYTTPFEKDDSFNNTVKSLIKKYGFGFLPQRSKLMDKPF